MDENIDDLMWSIKFDTRLLDDLLCTNNNYSQFISDIFAAFNDYIKAPADETQYHDFGIDAIGIIRAYIELVAKQYAEHIYSERNEEPQRLEY